MAQEAQGKVQRAVDEMLDQLERTELRPILRQAYLNCAKCLDDTTATKDQLSNCQAAAFHPPQQIQQTISNEMNNFQNRLSRCAQQCQDEARDNLTIDSTPQQSALLQMQMDGCVSKCCDSHIELLPKMLSRIRGVVNQVRATTQMAHQIHSASPKTEEL